MSFAGRVAKSQASVLRLLRDSGPLTTAQMAKILWPSRTGHQGVLVAARAASWLRKNIMVVEDLSNGDVRYRITSTGLVALEMDEFLKFQDLSKGARATHL